MQGDRCLAPSDLAPTPAWEEVLGASPAFVGAATPAQRAVLTQHLGVRQLSKAELYRDHILPRMGQLAPATSEAVMLEVRAWLCCGFFSSYALPFPFACPCP